MNAEQMYNDLENKYAENLTQQNQFLEEQSNIQNQQIDANTTQVVKEINQNKEYANQDYLKQSRGAYQDYQKVVNPYGVQAENAYSQGLGKAGYSETSKLNAYNTYQNRYASARSDAERAKTEFDNQIAEALLSGNKDKAQIALNKLQQQMTNMWNNLNLQTDLTNNRVSSSQWLEQFNYQKEQDALANALAREQFEYQKQQDALDRASSYSKSYSSSGSNSSDNYTFDDYFGDGSGNIYSADSVPDISGNIQNAQYGVANNVLNTIDSTSKVEKRNLWDAITKGIFS